MDVSAKAQSFTQSRCQRAEFPQQNVNKGCEFCTKAHIAVAAELLGSEDLVWSALHNLDAPL